MASPGTLAPAGEPPASLGLGCSLGVTSAPLPQGRKAKLVPGWDCHGLPIELKVLQVGFWGGLHVPSCTPAGMTGSVQGSLLTCHAPAHTHTHTHYQTPALRASVHEGGGAPGADAAAAAQEGRRVCAQDGGRAAGAIPAVGWALRLGKGLLSPHVLCLGLAMLLPTLTTGKGSCSPLPPSWPHAGLTRHVGQADRSPPTPNA